MSSIYFNYFAIICTMYIPGNGRGDTIDAWILVGIDPIIL